MARKTATKEAPVANGSKANEFDKVLQIINKNMPSDTGSLIAKLGTKPMEVETISSGSVVLDSLLGGGVAKGRLIEIYGPEASGKTSIALTVAGNVQKKGGNAVFIDLENALDPRYARKLGVDTDTLAVSQPDHAEQTFDLIYNLTRSGIVDLIVVDSIASMVPREELEGDADKQTIGLLARLMSKNLKKLISLANRTETTIIFINQTRDNIGGFSPFGTPQTTTGGKAMKFYASQRIEVKRVGQVKEGTKIIGNEVKLKIVKNKIAPPFAENKTILTFNKGINRAAEVVEVGKDYPTVIEMPNNRTYIDASTGEVIAKSKADAIKVLEENPELLEKLNIILQEEIAKSLFDDNNASEEEETEENLTLDKETELEDSNSEEEENDDELFEEEE